MNPTWLAKDAHRRAVRRAKYHRRKARDHARQLEQGLVGYLHALSCHKPDHMGNKACRPIPVYERAP